MTKPKTGKEYTRDEILALPAGRDLDRLVAAAVGNRTSRVPRYSTDERRFLDVMRAMVWRGFNPIFSVSADDYSQDSVLVYVVTLVGNDETFRAVSIASPTLALCRAIALTTIDEEQ